MANNEEDFLDALSALPHQLLHYTLGAADSFGRTCDELSLSIRENLSKAAWLPPSARPKPPQSLRTSNHMPPLRPRSYAKRLHDLIFEHQGLAIALVAFVGTGSVLYYQQRRAFLQKRRAKRELDGTRKEVVVIAGSPTSPIPHSLALDLERRGFIVYITSTSHEENLIRNERKKDLIPIHINFDDPFDTSNTIQHFVSTLETSPRLHLAGLIVVPDLEAPPSPIEAATLENWSEAFNTKLLHNISLTQALIRTLIASNGRVLILTPTITSSLRLPFHGLESTTVAALEGFTNSLQVELRNTDVGVCNIKLGNVHVEGRDRTALTRDTNSEVLSWRREIKDTYGDAFMTMSGHANPGVRGSPVRELHNTVFDIITQERRPWSVVRVGRGSLVYPLFGQIAPRRLIGWLLDV